MKMKHDKLILLYNELRKEVVSLRCARIIQSGGKRGISGSAWESREISLCLSPEEREDRL